jgi:hypothetical protein
MGYVRHWKTACDVKGMQMSLRKGTSPRGCAFIKIYLCNDTQSSAGLSWIEYGCSHVLAILWMAIVHLLSSANINQLLRLGLCSLISQRQYPIVTYIEHRGWKYSVQVFGRLRGFSSGRCMQTGIPVFRRLNWDAGADRWQHKKR